MRINYLAVTIHNYNPMTYLYHHVPKNMQGDTLYPLNVLKEKYPEAYAEHARKYAGREEAMQFVIPKLDCLWNDALHLSAVHPQMMMDAFAEAGGRSDYTLLSYQIDPYTLDPDKAVVYRYSTVHLNALQKKEDFVDFNPDDLAKYSELPQDTIEYYRESFANKKLPLAFHRVPHILYKGTIDVEGVKVVEV